jgi:hypothetical protein
MANPGYVRSTDGSDADNGSTWALANATLAGAITDAVAGDTIYVSQVHAESTASSVVLTFPGTLASPNFVLCGNDGASPPTALATTATVSTTGSTNLTVTGSAYIYGLTFNCGTGSGNQILVLASNDNTTLHAKNCTFALVCTGSTARIQTGSASVSSEGTFYAENCTFTFANAGQGLNIRLGTAVKFHGGSIAGSAITTLIAAAPAGACVFEWSGGDLSAGASTMNLVVTSAAATGRTIFRNCKLPASWSGSLLGGAPSNTAFRAEMHNCDSGDTNYRMWVEDYSGSIRSETTIVRTGGASDGTTGLSWKMVSTANAEYPLITLDSPEIVRWNDTTGSAITVTVEVVTDNATLTNAECWVEVQYLGTSGFPLGSFVSDAKADFLATAANQASSSETWTTTGLTTPIKQALSVTFTPQEKGYIHAVVKLAKASKTVYVCPKLDVT